MDIPLLRAFIAVAEELNFARAARRLHMSASPLSHQIRVLEARVGQKLFSRNSRSVHLTEAGEFLLPKARRLVAEADQLWTELRSHNGDASGPLRLGYSGGLGGRVYALLLPQLLRANPGILPTIRERTGMAVQLLELLDGSLDIGLGYLPVGELPPVELEMLPLFTSRIVALVREDSPLAAAGRVTLGQLAELSLITTDGTPQQPYVRHMNALIEPADARLVPRWSAGGYGGVAAMVLAGLGAGFAISADAELFDQPGIRAIPIVDPTPRAHAVLIWRRREERGTVLAARSTISDLHARAVFSTGTTDALTRHQER
jgi:DNA-binding transcriptional LysR family regulator